MDSSDGGPDLLEPGTGCAVGLRALVQQARKLGEKAEQRDKGRDGGGVQAQSFFRVSFATLALSLRENLVAFLAVRAYVPNLLTKH